LSSSDHAHARWCHARPGSEDAIERSWEPRVSSLRP
jgi:hypothetical protein